MTNLANIKPALAEIEQHYADIEAIRAKDRVILKDIEPALLGVQVHRYGHTYQISQVHIGLKGGIRVYGVRVNKKGIAGTRGFDLGLLSGCKFVEDEAKL